MPQTADDRAGRGRLAGVHAGSRERDYRHAVRVEFGLAVVLALTGPSRHADTFAEIREMQNRAEHFAFEGRTDVRIRRIANPQDAADVEELDVIANLEMFRKVPRVAAQRIPVAKRADDDVALRDRRHAPGRQLELVVARLVVEHSHGHEHAFLARDVRGQPQLVADLIVLGDRGELVDDDRLHDVPSPARVCRLPGNERIFE